MKDIWKWVWTGGGFAVVLTLLTFAGRYAISQEITKKVAPMEAEQQSISQQIADMKFEDRYREAQQELRQCMIDHQEAYCDLVDEWRWEVYYPYLDCIAGLAYRDREPICGPEPQKPLPPEEDIP